MDRLPHEVDRWGPELRRWVEDELLTDLTHYVAPAQALLVDWSRVTQEGHWRDYRGAMLESLSDVDVRDASGALIATGWMDFLSVSADDEAAPIIFWLFLDVVRDGVPVEMKRDAYPPRHVWSTLADEQKAYGASTDWQWLERDPEFPGWESLGPS